MREKDSCDLHVHSVYSEGSLTPKELVQRARDYDLRAVVLTDHNDISGVQEFASAASQRGIRTFSGIELYTSFRGRILHLLGYGFNPEDTNLRTELEKLQEDHLKNFSATLAALRTLGFYVNTNLPSTLRSRYPGFSHIAAHLQENPVNREKLTEECGSPTPSLFTIINTYFTAGKPAHLPQSTLTLESATKCIVGAGGIAILAHPGQQLTSQEDRIINDACAAGVSGIEVFSPYHTWHQIEYYQKLALEKGWIITGGSDFHTDINFTKKEPVANQWDVFRVPFPLYTQLTKRLKNI